MKELLLLKDVAYTAKTGGGTITGYDEVNLLADGAIAFFNKQGTLIDGTTPVPTDQEVYAAVGRGDYPAKISTFLNRLALNYNKQAAVASTVKKETATFANVTYTAGTTVSIELTNTDKPHYFTGRSRIYTYEVLVGDDYQDIATGLAAAVTADIAALRSPAYDCLATATASTGVITFTGASNVEFHVSSWGSISNVNCTVAVTQAFVRAIGTPAQIVASELADSFERGNHNYLNKQDLLWKESSKVDSTVTYVQYQCITSSPYNDVLGSKNNNVTRDILIAVPTGSAVITQLDNIFAAL